jgi:hypothetical protein
MAIAGFKRERALVPDKETEAPCSLQIELDRQTDEPS